MSPGLVEGLKADVLALLSDGKVWATNLGLVQPWQ